MKNTLKAALLMSVLMLVAGNSWSADTAIENSNYVCRSESGSSSLFKRNRDGSLRAITFAAAKRQVKKQQKKIRKKIKALKARIKGLSGRAKNRARQKLTKQRSKLTQLKQVLAAIKECQGDPGGCRGLTAITIAGSTSGIIDVNYSFVASATPSNASSPISYSWSPEPAAGQGTFSATYSWSSTGSQTVSVEASNCGGSGSDDHTITINELSDTALIHPNDLVYQGAFRLPGGDTPPKTFSWGGNAMTFNSDSTRTGDGILPGSLFVMGHDRQAWDTLPNGNQVAEISIPQPVVSDSLSALPTAEFVQEFKNVTAGFFTDLEEVPKTGMQYLNHALTGAKIHLAWGQHLQPDAASHAWFNPDLSNPQLQGVWYIGSQDPYRVNGYMFEIPAAWADVHANGRYLGCGRFRDGGQGSMGPVLLAYRPWQADGSAPPSGTRLSETALLLYENVYNTDQIVRALNGYQHADEWEGGSWLTIGSGKAAVLFAGNKAIGAKNWYGYRHNSGPDIPCVDPHSVGEFRVCIQADGTDCPNSDLGSCPHSGERGWWASRWQAQLILYDPDQLAQVAAGTLNSWEPQPYASIDIEEHLFLNPAGVEEGLLGSGVQRRYKIGAAAFDRTNGYLYVLELFADDSKPLVHVWRVQ